MKITEKLKVEFDIGRAKFKQKSLRDNVKDLSINIKYHAKLLKSMGVFAKSQGLLNVLKIMKQYPWLKEILFHVEGLFSKLVLRRTGEYREANAMIIELIFSQLTELIAGTYEHPEKTVLHEDMVPSHILVAMGLKPWMAEFSGMIMPLVFPSLAERYIDASENN